MATVTTSLSPEPLATSTLSIAAEALDERAPFDKIEIRIRKTGCATPATYAVVLDDTEARMVAWALAGLLTEDHTIDFADRPRRSAAQKLRDLADKMERQTGGAPSQVFFHAPTHRIGGLSPNKEIEAD